MLSYAAKYKKQFILGPACKLTEAILELLVPLVMAKIVDVGIKNGDIPYILKMGGLMLLLGVAGLCFAVICQYCAAVAQQGMGTDLRRDLLKKINSFSPADRAKFSNSTLITRITNDVNQIQSAAAMLIRLVFRSPFLIAGSLIMAMALDLRLSVIFFGAGLLVSALMYYVLSKTLPLYKSIQKKLDKLMRKTGESLSGARVIRALVREDYENQRFAEENKSLTAVCMRVAKLNACLNPATFAIINLALTLLLLLGGKKVNTGSLTTGEVIALTNYMTQILLSIIVFANVIVIFTKAGAGIERVNEVLNTEPTQIEGSKDSMEITEYAVEFENADFSFQDSEEKALSNINLKIKTGETIGIIGGTGSGKSALVNLILRLYDADCGEVRVFGENVQSYTFGALRRGVHIVSQGSRLFKGTVKFNLTCGRTDITDEQLKNALEIAQCTEFISKLPLGLDSPVKEGGKNFSGGQRQRLCIARAVAGNPHILIFDDSSSALDFATDAKFRQAVRQRLAGKTVIFVAQRVSTVKDADKIFLIDDGRIEAEGTHGELYASSPLYREICRSQQASEEGENENL